MEPGAGQRCASCGETNPDRAKFCLECGSPLSGAGSSRSDERPDILDQLPQETGVSGERRIVTVVFADLSGFTAYSEGSDVEDVRAIAHETAERLGDIVERYGGTVDKIIGDCVMAVFGAPFAHEDDPERAVRAALEMQECVAENQQRFAGLALCVGLQTGEAMWAPVGPDGRYTVLGDTVNTAARLQGAAGKGEVLIGQPTHHSVGDVIECEPMEPIKAKNKAEPVPAWRAVSVKGERSRHKPVLAPLTGRDAELSRLREVWEHVRTENRVYGVTLVGPAGVGKSRLVSSFTDAAGSTALVLTGRCLPFGDGITYWPLIEIIQQLAEIKHDDDRETVSRKLGVLLEALGSEDLDELRTMAVALANLIGAPTTPRGTYTAKEISRGELHWALRRILELVATRLPLVLVVEDLHWAEPTLLELIGFITDGAEPSPMLVVSTARPEFKETANELLQPRTNRRTIELGNLGDDASRAIVTSLLGGTELEAETLEEILRSAGGNPLYLEEVAQVWREGGASGAALGAVPTGLRALIDSRLDGLGQAERRVVATAAVVGDVFWRGTVDHLAQGTDVDPALDSLESRDLIRLRPSSSLSGEREYVFKSGLIRDAAYQRLSKAERAALHESCGSWIAGLPGGEQEFAEVIAFHLEQSCRIAAELSFAQTAPAVRAARALMRAGEKAEAREGMREAESFLARAIDLMGDEMPETSLDLSLRRARLIVGLGRYKEGHELCVKVAERSAQLGHVGLRARALETMAGLEVTMGLGSEAAAHLDEAEELARRSGNALLRVKIRCTRALAIEVVDGPGAAAIDMLQSAVALAEELGDEDATLTARMRLGTLFYNKGELEPAQIQFERSIQLARQSGSVRHESWLTGCLGQVRFHRGPRAEAAELYERAAEWTKRMNDRYMHVQSFVWRAEAALAERDWAGALKLVREANEIARDIGATYIGSLLARYTAEALAQQGRGSEAREVVDAARARFAGEDTDEEAILLIADAFVSFGTGDAAAARASFARALPLFDAHGATLDLGEARLAFARMLEAIGDLTSATDQLERARELFDRMGALATVAYIDQRMAGMRDADLSGTSEAAESEPIV